MIDLEKEIGVFDEWFETNMDETEPKAMCEKTWLRQQFIIDDLQKRINDVLKMQIGTDYFYTMVKITKILKGEFDD